MEPDLDQYYRANVIGGRNSFVQIAKSTDDFAVAIQQKLFREITGVPVHLAVK